MTLDEAIKHCEEVADICEYEASRYDMTDAYESHMACQQGLCAEKHRQLAEWLRELKALRESEELKDVFNNCETCKYLKLDSDDYPCDRCMHRYINQYVYDDKREVNADDGDSN